MILLQDNIVMVTSDGSVSRTCPVEVFEKYCLSYEDTRTGEAGTIEVRQFGLNSWDGSTGDIQFSFVEDTFSFTDTGVPDPQPATTTTPECIVTTGNDLNILSIVPGPCP